jgi:hypothetical protein
MRLAWGRPEIVDNEKGLLVAFAIIGVQLNNAPAQQSLSFGIGPVQAGETVQVQWLLTSSLFGIFRSFNATFNTNPLGDKTLTLVDAGRHARADARGGDGARALGRRPADFLANDFKDAENAPDAVYSSTNGSEAIPISRARQASVSELDPDAADGHGAGGAAAGAGLDLRARGESVPGHRGARVLHARRRHSHPCSAERLDHPLGVPSAVRRLCRESAPLFRLFRAW